VYRAKAISNGRQIQCDFRRSTASVPTSSIIGVADILRTAVRLLRSLTEDEVEFLEEILSTDSASQAESGDPLSTEDYFDDDHGDDDE
jgi:hypothetical protein